MPSLQRRQPQVQRRSRAKRSTGGGAVAEGHRLSSRGRPTRAAAAEKERLAAAKAAAKAVKVAARAVKAKAAADKKIAKAAKAKAAAAAKAAKAAAAAAAAEAAKATAYNAAMAVLGDGNQRFCTWINIRIII